MGRGMSLGAFRLNLLVLTTKNPLWPGHCANGVEVEQSQEASDKQRRKDTMDFEVEDLLFAAAGGSERKTISKRRSESSRLDYRRARSSSWGIRVTRPVTE